MSKTYRYRQSILIFKYVMIAVFFTFIVLSTLNFQNEHFSSYIYLLLALISLPIIYYTSLLGDTEISLTEEEIVFLCNKKKIAIKYKDITKIDVVSLEKFGGYIHIYGFEIAPIYISIRLEDLDDLLRRLYQKLLKIEHHETKNDRLFDFYKIAIEVKYQHNRLKKIIKYFLFYLILNLAYIFVVTQADVRGMVITLFFGYLVTCLIAYVFIELRFYSPKVHTIQLSQNQKVVDQSKTHDLLFYVWLGLSFIHLITICIITLI